MIYTEIDIAAAAACISVLADLIAAFWEGRL